MANRITTLFDLDSKGFDSSLKTLRKNVSEADGAMGKLKVAGNGVGDALKANLGAAALGAGTALVAFGVKAVGAFTETALAAGKFSDATGIAVDDASRWMEVGGDVGVGADAIQGAIQKMNKALADGKPAFEQYGVEVVKTADGVVDANATFQNALTTIGAIVDPTKRAQAAQQVFGKSYAEVAELMNMSATELEAALKGVSDSKVIDQKELAKAREFRAAMDTLRDSVEDVALKVGERLTPLISRLAWGLDQLDKGADKVSSSPLGFVLDGWGDIADSVKYRFGELTDGLGITSEETESYAETVAVALARQDYYTQRIRAHKGEIEELAGKQLPKLTKEQRDAADEASRAAAATRALDAAYQALIGSLDQEEAWERLGEAMFYYQQDTDKSTADTREYVRTLAEVVTTLDGIPEQQQVKLLAQLEDGDVAVVEEYLLKLRQGVIVPVKFQGQGGVGFEKRAKGGPVAAGSPYLVGEQGPELVVPSSNGTVIPAGQTAAMLGGGKAGTSAPMVINITTGADPQAVIAAIKKFEKSNGAAWRS